MGNIVHYCRKRPFIFIYLFFQAFQFRCVSLFLRNPNLESVISDSLKTFLYCHCQMAASVSGHIWDLN